MFTRSGGVWTQQGDKLVGTGGNLGTFGIAQGTSVALSGDGSTAIVGGPQDSNDLGAAWVFTRSNGVWTQQGDKLVGTGRAGTPQQGSSVSLSADGSTAIVGGLVDNTGTGAHDISTTDPAGLGLQVEGFGFATSYYYPGGLNLMSIVISDQHPDATHMSSPLVVGPPNL